MALNAAAKARELRICNFLNKKDILNLSLICNTEHKNFQKVFNLR